MSANARKRPASPHNDRSPAASKIPRQAGKSNEGSMCELCRRTYTTTKYYHQRNHCFKTTIVCQYPDGIGQKEITRKNEYYTCLYCTTSLKKVQAIQKHTKTCSWAGLASASSNAGLVAESSREGSEERPAHSGTGGTTTPYAQSAEAADSGGDREHDVLQFPDVSGVSPVTESPHATPASYARRVQSSRKIAWFVRRGMEFQEPAE